MSNIFATADVPPRASMSADASMFMSMPLILGAPNRLGQGMPNLNRVRITYMSTLKDRIRMALAASGKTQTELARACGVKPPSVNDWTSGKTQSMKAVPAQRAAAFLGVSVLWLTEGKGPMAPDEDAPPVVHHVMPASAASDAPENLIEIDVVQNAVAGVLDAFGLRYEDLVGDVAAARARIERVLSRGSAEGDIVRTRVHPGRPVNAFPQSRATRTLYKKRFPAEVSPDQLNEEEERTERIQERRI